MGPDTSEEVRPLRGIQLLIIVYMGLGGSVGAYDRNTAHPLCVVKICSYASSPDDAGDDKALGDYLVFVRCAKYVIDIKCC